MDSHSNANCPENRFLGGNLERVIYWQSRCINIVFSCGLFSHCINTIISGALSRSEFQASWARAREKPRERRCLVAAERIRKELELLCRFCQPRRSRIHVSISVFYIIEIFLWRYSFCFGTQHFMAIAVWQVKHLNSLPSFVFVISNVHQTLVQTAVNVSYSLTMVPCCSAV